jgi:hypothetical protein
MRGAGAGAGARLHEPIGEFGQGGREYTRSFYNFSTEKRTILTCVTSASPPAPSP